MKLDKKSASVTENTDAEKSGEHKWKTFFNRLVVKYDLLDEKKLALFGKWLIYVLLVCVGALMILQRIDELLEGHWQLFFIIVGLVGTIILAETLKLFGVAKGKGVWVLYVIDAVMACGLLFVASGTYVIIIYMLILTEIYLSSKKTAHSMWLFLASLLVYSVSCVIYQYYLDDETELLQVLTGAIGSGFAIVVHFVVLHIAFAFYRQFLRLDKTLKELNESKAALQKAYDNLAEVTVLEERQRIAKDIHDTAGHSITTVIMQTEAAKLILDDNPAEAKSKIVAANLQAKHALEELRESVHLLSGNNASQTLKDALENVIHESTDGTGIVIRSEIEDFFVSPAKHRFLCNTLKEGISNGLRHGNATAFWFECKIEEEKIKFLLSDNGKGLHANPPRLGFGLTSMQDRVKALGGEIRFESVKDEGFEICLTLPMDIQPQ